MSCLSWIFALQLLVSVYLSVSWVLHKYPETGRMLVLSQSESASTEITYCPWVIWGLGMRNRQNNRETKEGHMYRSQDECVCNLWYSAIVLSTAVLQVLFFLDSSSDCLPLFPAVIGQVVTPTRVGQTYTFSPGQHNQQDVYDVPPSRSQGVGVSCSTACTKQQQVQLCLLKNIPMWITTSAHFDLISKGFKSHFDWSVLICINSNNF